VGYSNERVDLFVAWKLSHEGHPGEDGEFIECVRLSLGEALEMVRLGEITEAKTILGLFWAERLQAGVWK
jgi:ADP-ribose pyrophosphatase